MKNDTTVADAMCGRALERAAAPAIREIKRLLAQRARGEVSDVYDMLRYFMGFLDADFKPATRTSGGHLRAGLCLLLADAYGVRKHSLDAAVAIELFHNFTLLHDDVEDHDEIRRGRPTVWKLWGVNKAINAGDVQCLLVAERVVRAGSLAYVGPQLSSALLRSFIEVWEGQHLDFELADAVIGTRAASEGRLLLMTQKKTGALVRVAAEVGGIVAGKNIRELKNLREFGMSLGLAFQIADDYCSVWATKRETGKDTHSDVREHKRTLPVLRAYKMASAADRRRLKKLYSVSRQLTNQEIAEARSLINATDARLYVASRVGAYASRAKKAAQTLSIPKKTQTLLCATVDMLVQDIAWDVR